MTRWQPVIGLELHMRLKTASKMFSGAPSAYGGAPNTRACAVDIALPGVLPMLNGGVLKMAVAFGLVINARIAERSVFARKNYFYPDLPKGYQISQYESPIVEDGRLEIALDDGGVKTVGIERAHLEEDAGKSVHGAADGMTGVDLNRAGTPLMEIVSRPHLAGAGEAVAYMKKIHSIGCFLGICDGNMQEGSLRCDVNVSLKPAGAERLGVRAEIKNLNSFRFVERAIRFEIKRQAAVLESGGEVAQETRLYDPDRDETRPMRGKEEAEDYRYFPDPDLLPVAIPPSLVEQVRAALPELQEQMRERFVRDYGLSEADAVQLTASPEMAAYFEDCAGAGAGGPRLAANWITGALSAALNQTGTGIADCPLGAPRLAALLDRIEDGTLSGNIAREVFDEMWRTGAGADEVIADKGLAQISDTGELAAIIAEVIANSEKQVAQYRAGKEKVFGYFVGQVMKATQGRANPGEVNRLLKERLERQEKAG
ncbi:MAG: Asp-tRNA(Asn)/Glu-tRNA(Gln) amidotransferase subunit GatB [Gammaproteobacteria bacterium]|nr:Asp-tRNA(Asn)/Glu-tRNA(Gln) amidotransferase subunit GatB [Gammaproteobacteria bacterium]